MKTSLPKTQFIILFIWLLNLGGCATPIDYGPLQNDFDSESELLSHLKIGASTKGELIELFGTPNATIVDGKVITYRIVIDENGRVLIPIVITKWKLIKYSLVLVFRDDKTLIDYSLVSIK